MFTQTLHPLSTPNVSSTSRSSISDVIDSEEEILVRTDPLPSPTNVPSEKTLVSSLIASYETSLPDSWASKIAAGETPSALKNVIDALPTSAKDTVEEGMGKLKVVAMKQVGVEEGTAFVAGGTKAGESSAGRAGWSVSALTAGGMVLAAAFL